MLEFKKMLNEKTSDVYLVNVFVKLCRPVIFVSTSSKILCGAVDSLVAYLRMFDSFRVEKNRLKAGYQAMMASAKNTASRNLCIALNTLITVYEKSGEGEKQHSELDALRHSVMDFLLKRKENHVEKSLSTGKDVPQNLKQVSKTDLFKVPKYKRKASLAFDENHDSNGSSAKRQRCLP